MEIQQTRIVLRARDFQLTSHFYEQILGFSRLRTWEAEDGRRSLFQAGTAALEVRGRSAGKETPSRDEDFDYSGPNHKLSIEILVPSADAVYKELLFREPNIPGGLMEDEGGTLLFSTHDPDGVRVIFREA